MKQCVRIIAVVLFFASMVSCKPLKPYDRIFVNDPDMQMTTTADMRFQKYVQSIREGANEAQNHKGSGGCGCN